jgi:hypothetical protein
MGQRGECQHLNSQRDAVSKFYALVGGVQFLEECGTLPDEKRRCCSLQEM